MKWFAGISSLVLLMLMMPILTEGECSTGQSSCYQDDMFSRIYSFEVMKNDTGGWFYIIKKADKSFIIQKNIPAINQNVAFKDSIQSSIVAKSVMNKLKKGDFPPTITVSEINKLQIKY